MANQCSILSNSYLVKVFVVLATLGYGALLFQRNLLLSSHLASQTLPDTEDQEGRTPHLPWIVIHVGPRKTATTSIQATMASLTQTLRRDNIVYIGHQEQSYHDTIGKYLRGCIAPNPIHDPPKNNACSPKIVQGWMAFEERLHQLAHMGVNVVISDEGLPRFDRASEGRVLNALEKATRGIFGRRQVTVTYRHYFEWYLSEYNQMQKSALSRNFVEGFVDWHRNGTRRERILEHTTIDHIERFHELFGSVSVFNMHDYAFENLTTVGAWVCSELFETALHTCKALRSANETTINESDGLLVARRLAQLLLSNQNLRKLRKLNRTDLDQWTTWINDWISQQEAENRKIPKECLTGIEQELIWRESLRIRHDLLPDYDINDSILGKRMKEARARMCQVDYAKLSVWPAWIEFVSSKKGMGRV